MKRILFVTLSVLLAFTAGSTVWYIDKLHNERADKAAHTVKTLESATDMAVLEKLKQTAFAAKEYAASHHFNTQYCFLVDMDIASGKQRFFVYDLKQGKIEMAGLVTHGRCNQNWLAGRKYGNEVGCGCTSLGRYKVGNPYQGKFGLAYKLYGLDTSNSNAFNRFVVLHSHSCVPEKETDPSPICQSDGCPTVSPGFLQQLAGIIDKSTAPILLWIYN
ncbi:MAG: murein L,D-transpeptidase catalytic domain family protein [Chitinophagaceae bacterium]